MKKYHRQKKTSVVILAGTGPLPGVLSFLLFLFGCAANHPQTAMMQNGVRFAVHAPHATRVAVVGSFNRWDPGRDVLTGPDEHGVWSKTISLPEGRYEYLFLIDGKTWLPDPAAPSLDDGAGGRNSVIYVGT